MLCFVPGISANHVLLREWVKPTVENLDYEHITLTKSSVLLKKGYKYHTSVLCGGASMLVHHTRNKAAKPCRFFIPLPSHLEVFCPSNKTKSYWRDEIDAVARRDISLAAIIPIPTKCIPLTSWTSTISILRFSVIGQMDAQHIFYSFRPSNESKAKIVLLLTQF